MYRRTHLYGMDHSLDEFLKQSDTTDQNAGDSQDSQNSKNEIQTARSTMVWTADGAACETCGEVVHRRWRERERTRDDERLVCSACKEW